MPSSLAEVDRCVKQLGFKGFQVFSNVAGKMLDGPEFRPVFQRIAALGVPVHLHPAMPINCRGLDTASLIPPLGFTYDTTLSTLRLIHSGLFDEAPSFKLIVAHVGGVIPYLKGRLETFSVPSPIIPHPPRLCHALDHYLEALYVDTVCYHPAALECCYKVMGADHLLFGTDHPFADYARAAELVEQLDCSACERELIYHGNAERLFG